MLWVLVGLSCAFLGTALLALSWGFPWQTIKSKRPMWEPDWSPAMQMVGFVLLITGFVLQVVGYSILQ